MLIHELAQRANLPIDTIRFYEKQGLLDHTHFSRRANNYRVYTDAAISRLRVICQGQAAGFSLREMRSLIQAWEQDELPMAQKEAIVRDKIEEINGRIQNLLECKAYLEAKLAAAREAA